jgi:UDP-glucose 4-epimerase
MKVLVTGGAGFIGSHLVDALRLRGAEVVVVDKLVKGRLEHLAAHIGADGFEFAQGDILDRDWLLARGRGVDAVVHLAASKIPRYGTAMPLVTSNIEGARNALDLAAREGARFVLASTSDVYGKSPDLPFRESGDLVIGRSTSRRWSYAISKLVDEHMAYAYHDEYGIDVVVLRYFGAYGPRQYLDWWGGPQGVFLEAIEHTRPIELHGDGSQTRCFVDVRDLAHATVLAVERAQAANEIVNVGTDEEISIRDLARLMHELSGKGGEPDLVLVPYRAFSPGYEDVPRRVPDLSKAREVLGFEPSVTLREGLTELWAWYRSRADATPGSDGLG